jgi:hypothetical protein
MDPARNSSTVVAIAQGRTPTLPGRPSPLVHPERPSPRSTKALRHIMVLPARTRKSHPYRRSLLQRTSCRTKVPVGTHRVDRLGMIEANTSSNILSSTSKLLSSSVSPSTPVPLVSRLTMMVDCHPRYLASPRHRSTTTEAAPPAVPPREAVLAPTSPARVISARTNLAPLPTAISPSSRLLSPQPLAPLERRARRIPDRAGARGRSGRRRLPMNILGRERKLGVVRNSPIMQADRR